MEAIGLQTAQIIAQQVELLIGKTPPTKDTQGNEVYEPLLTLIHTAHEGGQWVHPLAFLVSTEFPENRWSRNPVLINTVIKAIDTVAEQCLQPDPRGTTRRLGHAIHHAFRLLRNDFKDVAAVKTGLSALIRNQFLIYLKERENLTVFSSANVGYGTNHLAIELSAVAAYLRVFENDADFAQMTPGGLTLRPYLKDYLARFMNYMNDGGYWAETDGPANVYTSLSANALLRTAIDLGEVETYRAHFEKTADFHTWFTLPNLSSVGVTDGRNHQTSTTKFAPSYGPTVRSAFQGLTPTGKAHLASTLDIRYQWSQSGKALDGETLNELITNIYAEPYFTTKTAPLTWHQDRYDYTTRQDFGVQKRGPWIIALSNLRFRPRPEGHFTLDYQNIFSLYHQNFGIIFKGDNSKNDPELSTFNKAFGTIDSYPITEPLWQYVPEEGHFQIQEQGCTIFRDYRGFEGTLDFEILSAQKSVLKISVNARKSVYPVNCSLQPAAHFGRGFTDGFGKKIELGEESFCLSGKDVGNVMILTPEEQPDLTQKIAAKPIKLTLPDDAEIRWPFKHWNCYDLVTHRYTTKDATLLLKIPVTATATSVGIELL